MTLQNDQLKTGVEAINVAILKAFLGKEVTVDEIVWNPHRGGLVNARFSIHSIQVTVGNWQKTLYRIDTQDILDYGAQVESLRISRYIEDLADHYWESLESADLALAY